MPNLPRTPRAGEKLEGSWGAQVVDYLRAITPRSGPNILVRIFSGGAVISGNAGGAGGGRQESTYPFQVYDATSDSGAGVGVRFGTVNDETPTIGGTALDAETPPVLDVVSGAIYLDATLDAETGEVTAVEVKNGAVPAGTLTHAYKTLATVTVADGVVTGIAQAVTHSLEHRRCGVNDHHFWGV